MSKTSESSKPKLLISALIVQIFFACVIYSSERESPLAEISGAVHALLDYKNISEEDLLVRGWAKPFDRPRVTAALVKYKDLLDLPGASVVYEKEYYDEGISEFVDVEVKKFTIHFKNGRAVTSNKELEILYNKHGEITFSEQFNEEEIIFHDPPSVYKGGYSEYKFGKVRVIISEIQDEPRKGFNTLFYNFLGILY